ncbi:hypothetical protein [Chryseobacterium arthrosphaerae]|uniref:DUF4340 domain-containing protein n=1 Tax=Chryseobacterium arthrosphaerae TaxID=651561 RepID=A0A1B8ZIN6_9FLAO|nr:hypothetical protein [Chryseobacterium arthrosphaerae]OCA71387.1 hypothetical protein BBI00_16855 [Chryseobacterium arthrosphaerae]
MSKKKIIVPLILILAAAVYWIFFHKDKTLKFIPENTDAVVVIDVKKLTGQYLFSLVTHPSKWSGSPTKDNRSVSFKNSGIRVPDFFQIFHVRDSKFSEWYSVLELKDSRKFIAFLKSRQFIDKGNGNFQKDQIFIAIEKEYCIAGTSDQAFESIKKQLLQTPGNSKWNAGQLIHNTAASISFISGQKIQNFSVEVKDDEIEIRNSPDTKIFNSIASRLQKGNHFLEMELDAENVKNYARFFNKSLADSSDITYLRAAADLEQVNDTIISYEYDDDFNEIEKKTVQKITQPDYIVDLQSRIPGKTWEYFQAKKWINAQDQFTAIPFQPNTISKTSSGVIIQSTRKPVSLSPGVKENYILIRNNPLLFSSLKTLSETEKKIISGIDYILYVNKAKDYRITVKAKKGELPLILRW